MWTATTVEAPASGGAAQAWTTAPEATTSVPSPTTVAPTLPPPRRGVLMAWTAGGLPAGFAPSVRDLPSVEALTVVRGELLHLVHTADRRGRTVEQVPEGWLVTPHASSVPGGPTAAEVDQIIQQSIAAANEIRAASGRKLAQVQAAGDEFLRLWESPQPVVVVGRSSRIHKEVYEAACRRADGRRAQPHGAPRRSLPRRRRRGRDRAGAPGVCADPGGAHEGRSTDPVRRRPRRGRTGARRQRLLGVAPGHVGDRSQRALPPEQCVVEGRDRAHVDAGERGV